ncbi:hypothetical protein BaRGS_00001436 [Batillaria attramentaria]|uniref:Uncharacterized protein n=1 Tax=Batillaria attramentaria TaxID=370345 RepID=A0ABD0M806_9CAEN
MLPAPGNRRDPAMISVRGCPGGGADWANPKLHDQVMGSLSHSLRGRLVTLRNCFYLHAEKTKSKSTAGGADDTPKLFLIYTERKLREHQLLEVLVTIRNCFYFHAEKTKSKSTAGGAGDTPKLFLIYTQRKLRKNQPLEALVTLRNCFYMYLHAEKTKRKSTTGGAGGPL